MGTDGVDDDDEEDGDGNTELQTVVSIEKNGKTIEKISVRKGEKLDVDDVSEEENFKKASVYYMEGAELEQHGETCEALRRYMDAIRLVPDIEYKLTKQKWTDEKNQNSGEHPSTSVSAEESVVDENFRNVLYSRIIKRGNLISPLNDQYHCSIDKLPIEILSKIVRYLIGNELAVHSLEALSMTCCVFYFLARDDSLWYEICATIFNSDKLQSIEESFSSKNWRNVFLAYPHPYFHGVYIGKCSYVRPGEVAVYDSSYRSWHIVTYFRLMRFFCDGHILLITSPDPPASVVPLMKSKFTRSNGLYIGQYRLVDNDRIIVEFERENTNSEMSRRAKNRRATGEFVPHEIIKQQFKIELRFNTEKKNLLPHRLLLWEKYEYTIMHLNGELLENTLDVNDSQTYPPLHFCCVKSF